MLAQARNALRRLEAYNVGPHDDQERREGRTRAQTRALNQQQATGLLASLGPINGDYTLRTLTAEQTTLKRQNEIPAEHAKEPELTTIAEARASAHADLWEGAMDLEFEELLSLIHI